MHELTGNFELWFDQYSVKLTWKLIGKIVFIIADTVPSEL